MDIGIAGMPEIRVALSPHPLDGLVEMPDGRLNRVRR
jgi:hypothetical protein